MHDPHAREHQHAYTRFLILGEGRTGSNLLVQALQSHPEVVCFREVFNWTHRRIDYRVPAYEHLRTSDLELRRTDPLRLLRERIFSDHGANVRAVGFKIHYGHALGYEGLEEALGNDTALRVIHLRRRNMLRTLVSFKLAEQGGIWEHDEHQNIRERLNRLVRAGRQAVALPGRRGTVTISPAESQQFFIVHQLQAQRYDELFADHPVLPLVYEEMVRDFPVAFHAITSFLTVSNMQPTLTLQRQNRKSLRETIRNYDELRAAFAGTPEEAFFDD